LLNEPIYIPKEYKGIIKQGLGHKSNANDFIKESFILWLESQSFIIIFLYGKSQTILDFNNRNICADIRCKSGVKDEKFSTFKKTVSDYY
jgi:hypothetical protein